MPEQTLPANRESSRFTRRGKAGIAFIVLCLLAAVYFTDFQGIATMGHQNYCKSKGQVYDSVAMNTSSGCTDTLRLKAPLGK